MAAQTEGFANMLIGAKFVDQGWEIRDGISIRYEYALPNGGRNHCLHS